MREELLPLNQRVANTGYVQGGAAGTTTMARMTMISLARWEALGED